MSPDSSESTPHDIYRLPTNVKPSHYDVTFWTDLESLEFGGLVAVDLDIREDTSAIVLNCANDLKLGDASVQCADQLQSAQIVADKELGRATLNFIATLPAGSKAQVKIAYSATLRGSMNGYYKSAWQRNGKTEYYGLTQFQPTDARAAVPCWDEPQLKATWTITMISRAETVNISNMAAESEVAYDPTSAPKSDGSLGTLLATLPKKDARWKITKFQETPPISSYLVAFANGPFAHLETKVVMPLSGRTVALRVYATPDIVHQGEFCLEVTAKVLPLYETIFDIEYPLPKLDVLAANDFDMGAMENWGLITGRTAVFLMDPKKADIASRKAIAGTQSHEVAHMWFGNITTMAWWDNLYLNEGFATLMGDIVLSTLFPEWESTSAFVATHVTRAMTLDAKRSSHPIEVECPDANFINQIFDGLSYSKAASVLRMLSEYIGEERFLEGVTLYLKKHLYGNTVTRDLWDGISAASGEVIVHLMNNWITKIGFPLITVTETSTGIHVRQDRYLDNGTPTADENETIWNVPLVILTVDGNGRVHVDKTAILEQREKTIALDTSRTFKLNAGTTSLYRVSYIPERLEKIATEAAKEDSVFSLSDRIGLLYDVSELSKAGLTQVSSLLTLFDIWRNETNYLVWASMLSSFGEIAAAFEENTEISAGLRAFIRNLFGPLVQRLGYEFPEGESVDIVQLRKTAILGAVVGRDEGVTQELRSRFTDYIKTGDKTRIPSDLKKPIFTTAARYGGREEFDALLKIIEDPVNAADRSAAIRAIGSTEDSSLLDELFSYTLTKARDQDVVHFCLGLEANPLARPLLVPFFTNNYEGFRKRFATNSMLKYLVTTCFRGLSTQQAHDDAQEFFKDKDITRYSMALAQALETVRTRIAYIERSHEDLFHWLTKWEERSKL
ncbi:leucyl aminopeptidase [Mycena albidolilacea]|uniref:Aminopeptidase n=1 Tax=Mycena albidolilacea TaxID=1033008 RepID=A0AAD7EJ00_9AGAR|nr:leucyl aminopeptidase [Mycena albidolilacea]